MMTMTSLHPTPTPRRQAKQQHHPQHTPTQQRSGQLAQLLLPKLQLGVHVGKRSASRSKHPHSQDMALAQVQASQHTGELQQCLQQLQQGGLCSVRAVLHRLQARMLAGDRQTLLAQQRVQAQQQAEQEKQQQASYLRMTGRSRTGTKTRSSRRSQRSPGATRGARSLVAGHSRLHNCWTSGPL